MAALTGFPYGVVEAIAEHLGLLDVLPFGATSLEMHWIAAKTAGDAAKYAFEGVLPADCLRLGAREPPDWLKFPMALQPRCLVRGHRKVWPDQTRPLPFVLDTTGPWFVEFKLAAAGAPNGTPTIGLVDAGCPVTTSGEGGRHWPGDLSRRGTERFAISLAPYDGTVLAARPGSTTRCRARLRWEKIGDEQRKWNDPMSCGFLIENRKLKFFRVGGGGAWHSGETVCEDLPKQVSPCMFMSSYVGFALVQYVCLWNSLPETCPHCDANFQGFAEPWDSWN